MATDAILPFVIDETISMAFIAGFSSYLLMLTNSDISMKSFSDFAILETADNNIITINPSQ